MDLINKTEISSDRVREIIEFCELKDLGDYVMIVKDCDVPIRAAGHWDGGIRGVVPYLIGPITQPFCLALLRNLTFFSKSLAPSSLHFLLP
jgi:hypothetical protein